MELFYRTLSNSNLTFCSHICFNFLFSLDQDPSLSLLTHQQFLQAIGEIKITKTYCNERIYRIQKYVKIHEHREICENTKIHEHI